MLPMSASEDEVVLVYLRLVRQESTDAAAIVEQIYVRFGSPAALRAALILTLLKQEIERYHSVPEIAMYTYLLKDTREALPLLEEAIACCLESWGILQINRSGWEKWQRTPKQQSNELRNPFEDLLDEVRQHSPFTAIQLELIYDKYGFIAGCYGATALIWLEARIDKFGSRILDELTDWEKREFTYVHHMQDDVAAIADFFEMLDCYELERRRACSSALSTTQLTLRAEPTRKRGTVDRAEVFPAVTERNYANV